MINRLLVRDTDSRRRNLHIRTFSVMPLNENNGLVQWVDNTSVLRTILNDLYTRNYGPELTKTSKIGELYNSMLRPKGKLTTLEVGRRLTMDDRPCMIACGSPICACPELCGIRMQVLEMTLLTRPFSLLAVRDSAQASFPANLPQVVH